MSDTFALDGSYSTTPPTSGAGALAPSLAASLSQKIVLGKKQVADLSVGAVTPVVVGFGTLTNAHVIVLYAESGKVRARLTSTDGATQAVPFEGLLLLINNVVPVTALDLLAASGTSAVHVFLGERA